MMMDWTPQSSMEFQGLSIAVENPEGSTRFWQDENSGESGSTTMKYPYGYVKGTLGMDGDAVDVFVGPDASSEKVYIVTQMKKPGFDEVDEQKVMLGFTSASEARKAYLEHYNDSRFLGSMKEFSVTEFKEKLTSHKGKLIKHLFLALASANIPGVDKSFHEKGVDMDEKTMAKSCEHSKSVTCEKCNGTQSATDILKGLTSRMLSMTKRAVERAVAAPPVEVPEFNTQEVELFGPQFAQANHRDRPFEPPQVPVVSVATPAQSASPLAPDFMTSCGGCGYTHKSLSTCPRCSAIAATNREATPIWRR